jgi:hypothetical protein
MAATAEFEERMVRKFADLVERDRLDPFEAIAEHLDVRLGDDVAQLQLTGVAALAFAGHVEGYVPCVLQPVLGCDCEPCSVNIECNGRQHHVGNGFGVAWKSHLNYFFLKM